MSGPQVLLLLAAACQPVRAPHETGKDSADTGAGHDTGADSAKDTDTNGDETGDTDGDSDTDDSAVPVKCDHTQPWSYVAGGISQTCGVHVDGCAECWGAGWSDAGPSYSWQGEDMPPAGSYRSIEMLRFTEQGTGQHNCGILSDGNAVCFGDDQYGETEVPPGTYLDVAVAADHTFTVSVDGIVDWVGVGSALDRPDGVFTQVQAEDDYSLLLGKDGSLSEYYRLAELVYTLPGPYVAMSLGGDFRYVCAVTAEGAVECWPEEALDDAYFEEFVNRAPTEGILDVCVSTGQTMACALGEDGHVECWSPYEGDPMVDDAPTATDFVQLSCGAMHACALTSEGEITCWGKDTYGETVPPS